MLFRSERACRAFLTACGNAIQRRAADHARVRTERECFHDIAAAPDAAVHEEGRPAAHGARHLGQAVDRAAHGATLILGALGEEDMRKINALKSLGSELTLIRSTGGPQGNYHYLKSGPVFKDLPAPGLMDQTFADVQPLWSLDHLPAQAEVLAGSINFVTTPGAKSKIRWGADLAVAPLGRGKVIYCQFDIFSRLGKNALADALFANLIHLAR